MSSFLMLCINLLKVCAQNSAKKIESATSLKNQKGPTHLILQVAGYSFYLPESCLPRSNAVGKYEP